MGARGGGVFGVEDATCSYGSISAAYSHWDEVGELSALLEAVTRY